MASKKCPKCGEDNPAEAVMCWACYTPLSGSAPLGAGLAASAAVGALPKTAGAPVGVPTTDEPKKKDLDPKVIGLVALLLIGGGIAAVSSGMMGGGGGETPLVEGGGVDPAAAPAGGGVAAAPGGVAAPALSGAVAAASAPQAPVPIPFKTIASPGSGFKTGTVGILVTPGAASPAGAAKFAKNQFARNGGWANMQVAVFTDQGTADTFAEFQRGRDNAPLTPADFKTLADQGVWNLTPAFLDSKGSQERIYSPSKNPQSWWPGR